MEEDKQLLHYPPGRQGEPLEVPLGWWLINAWKMLQGVMFTRVLGV